MSSPLAAWESFYLLVGSASATLTGLVFVVIELIPEARAKSDTGGLALAAFATPTVSHFVVALLVSTLLSAPWDALWKVGVGIAVTGFAGFIYCVMIFGRMRRQTAYQPAREDWFWYLSLPLVDYAVLLVAGMGLRGQPREPLFLIAGAVSLLVFIGIHNAWDMVTFAMRERAKN